MGRIGNLLYKQYLLINTAPADLMTGCRTALNTMCGMRHIWVNAFRVQRIFPVELSERRGAASAQDGNVPTRPLPRVLQRLLTAPQLI